MKEDSLFRIDGRVAVVTGAGRGIGRSIAEVLSKAGACVAVVDREERLAMDTVRALNKRGDAIAVKADVSDSRSINRMIKRVLNEFKTIDILVNNAGILKRTGIDELEEEEWDAVLDVNLKGVYLVSRAVLPIMREHGKGRIINIASDAGKSTSTLGGAHYTTAKAGVLGFTRHLARELAPSGILVNAVCPGVVDTEMTRKFTSPKEWNSIVKKLPIGRAAMPNEIAAVVLFLASDAGSYFAGASLDVNGGTLII